MKIDITERWLKVFIDESGDADIDTSKIGASNYFICCAVVVSEDDLEKSKKLISEIASNFFSGSEIKSSRIGRNHKRRLNIIKNLYPINFGYFAFIVNKSRIKKDSGLQYRPSFYKFFNRMLYNSLFQSGSNLDIVADQLGGISFMNSFQAYLKLKGMPTLFSKWIHSFANSKDEPLIQLADLIAGTLTYIFDPGKKGEHSTNLHELLKPKELGLSGWPLILNDYNITNQFSGDGLSKNLHTTNIKRTLDFINIHENSIDEDRQMQVTVLLKLLFHCLYKEMSESRYLYSYQIISHLNNQNFPVLTKQQMHSKIIGPIRDSGIILSGSNKGLILANTEEDLIEYISHDKSIIEPMLNRLSKARRVVKMSTTDNIDILLSNNFRLLRKIADAFDDAKVRGL